MLWWLLSMKSRYSFSRHSLGDRLMTTDEKRFEDGLNNQVSVKVHGNFKSQSQVVKLMVIQFILHPTQPTVVIPKHSSITFTIIKPWSPNWVTIHFTLPLIIRALRFSSSDLSFHTNLLTLKGFQLISKLYFQPHHLFYLFFKNELKNKKPFKSFMRSHHY